MSETTSDTLGSRVRAYRMSLRFSQRGFAITLGISNNYLSEIESGKTNPRLKFFEKLFAVYPINPNYLFCGSGEISKNAQEQVPPKIATKEFIDAGEVNTTEELVSLMELSAGYKHCIIGVAARLLIENKIVLYNALAQEEKKAQADALSENKAKADTPDQ